MMRIGIVGCGKMADQHITQIMRIPNVIISAVCDRESILAQDMSLRWNIKNYYTDVKNMLEKVNLDIVHITTPPQSHHALAKICLDYGCHVYVEKPFTMDTSEAEDLIKLCETKNLKITAGHNAQYTPAMIRMRELLQKGYLGGSPVHIESHYCYEFGGEGYAKALLEDKNHWVRTLPGSLLQNIISHGISKIAEFLVGDNPVVFAYGFTSNFLKRLGEKDIRDEVRVIIKDENSTTAYFTFSSQMKPVPHQFRLYGPKNSLTLDEDHQILIKIDNKNYKSYLRYFIPPFQFSYQYLQNVGINFGNFLKHEFHLPNDSGLKTLIELFYKSVETNTPPPLSYREIILTSKIMDSIFAQVQCNPPFFMPEYNRGFQVTK